MLEWKAIWEQKHHRPFGGSYAVLSSSRVIQFLGAVLPKGCCNSATSDLQVMGFLECPACEAAKLREGPTAKPAHCTLHSFARVLLNSESELSPTLHWKLFEGENQTFISVRVPQGRTASLGWFLYVFLPHMIILWPSGYFVSLWSHTPCGTGVHRNIPYQNKLQRNCFLAQKLETLKAEFQHASLSKGISRRS